MTEVESVSHRLLAGLLALLAALAGVAATSRPATAAEQCFPATGRCVSGLFYQYWQANGGLAQQGYPISDELDEVSPTDGRPYRAQYFERARFEYHPESPAPYQVLLGLLGREQYQAKYPAGRPPGGAGEVCFAATGRCVRGVFHAYWQQHGGLQQQGYPLSDEFDEASPTDGRTYRAQYFERARFEYHPEHAGTPGEVLLGLLGREQFLARYPAGPGGYFATVPPGAVLPGDAECAARARRDPWEPRPANAAANRTLPSPAQLASYTAASWGYADAYHRRVTGSFSGTTDEIIQWAACKWGFDEDTVRAQAAQESWWRQATAGDREDGVCPPGYGGPCPHSFGLLQVRWDADPGARATFPLARDATAFSLDYALAVRRACYDGYESWLDEVGGGRAYGPGDEWGCIGRWYAGRWYTAGARDYIARVRRHLAEQAWRQPGFASR